MNQSELESFLEKNPNIECQGDTMYTYFRNKHLAWYSRNDTHCTRIENEVLHKLTPDELMHEISRGCEVEHITRITGYFTKVSQWNKGKLGELKDRVRTPIV